MGCPSYGSSAISVERCHPGLRRCEDGISAEAFYLVRDELPEATTGSRLLGFNYELSLGEATTLGASYLRTFAHADQKPTRNGLNVYNLRAYTAPFSSLPGLSFEAEYVRGGLRLGHLVARRERRRVLRLELEPHLAPGAAAPCAL